VTCFHPKTAVAGAGEARRKRRRETETGRSAAQRARDKRLVASSQGVAKRRKATRQRHRKGDLLSRRCGARRRRSTP